MAKRPSLIKENFSKTRDAGDSVLREEALFEQNLSLVSLARSHALNLSESWNSRRA